jgi:4-amino-4-deoxy-L-arabinose transferase-like glycosyltransferase
MLRLLEIALFLAPFVAFWLIRRAAGRNGPSRTVLAAAVLGLLLLVAGLMTVGLENAAPPGGRYVPAHLERGQIVPGRLLSPRTEARPDPDRVAEP